MDEDRMRALLDRAAAADQPPSTVNIARARLVGTRRRRIGRAVIPAASAGALATAAALIVTGTLAFGASGSRGHNPAVAGPAARTAYVSNYDSGTVTPVSTATNKAGKAIAVGAEPAQMAVTPDGRTVYVVSNSGTVTPVSTATNKPGKAIKVGKEPMGVVITPDGRTAYVNNYGSGTVTPVSTATNKAGKAIKVGPGPDSMVVTPDGRTVYVLDLGKVTPVSTATNKAGKAATVGGIRLGQEMFTIAVTPDGGTVYVVKSVSGTVTPISTATNKVGSAIKVGSRPAFIVFTR